MSEPRGPGLDQGADPVRERFHERPPGLGEPDGGLLPESEHDPTDAYVFPHPQWTVGVVMVLAVVMLFLGIFGHPVWLLIGAPFILTFLVWLGVRVAGRLRPRANGGNEGEAGKM